MPSHEKRVKDKRIMLDGVEFLAVVEYFQDTPERDGDMPEEKVFSTIEAAQKWLGKFPRDAWLGYDITEIIQHELDKGKRNARLRSSKGEAAVDLQATRPQRDPVREFGRTLVGSMP